MTITIVSLVVLLFLGLIIGGVSFLYSISPFSKHAMQSDIKTKALDIFIYLGIGISLVTSVTNVLQVLFVAIDRKFVDVLTARNYYIDASYSDVRFAIATLIVMFPIYVGLSWYTSSTIKKFHYKQDLPVRKIMVYCTLFISILTLVGTLVSVIYTYLGGELSIRFGFKALSVFVVALSLLGYYYYSLRRNYQNASLIPVIVTVLASLGVVASIVWSISVIGTPGEMRLKKIDSTRLSDISRIQSEVLNRVQMTDKLPVTLSELNNAFQGYQVPTDPVTHEAYGYRVVTQPVIKVNTLTSKKELVGQAVFELCATFDTVRQVTSDGTSVPYAPDKVGVSLSDSMYYASNSYYEGDVSPFWNHGKGKVCFKRIIASEMYYGR